MFSQQRELLFSKLCMVVVQSKIGPSTVFPLECRFKLRRPEWRIAKSVPGLEKYSFFKIVMIEDN